jgi:hypothetical protein
VGIHLFLLKKEKEIRSSLATESVILSNLHDGHFDGIWLAPNKRVHLFLRTAIGQPLVMVLDGVQAVALTEFKLGNIIFDFTFRSGDKLVLTDMEELFGVESDPDSLLRMMETAIARGLQLLEISSSYGARGLVLFRSWSVSHRENQM